MKDVNNGSLYKNRSSSGGSCSKMIHNIFYDKKHKEYTNICITHSYEVMSEFYKSIPELVYSLREVATIFIEDRLPKITNDEYFKRYSELVNEEDCNLKYIMTVDCKPIKTNRYRNLERAYMLYDKH